jgi:hypothetical protein
MMQVRVTSPFEFMQTVLKSPGAIWRATSTRELHLWWKMKSNSFKYKSSSREL